jgi:hypothetical protein
MLLLLVVMSCSGCSCHAGQQEHGQVAEPLVPCHHAAAGQSSLKEKQHG